MATYFAKFKTIRKREVKYIIYFASLKHLRFCVIIPVKLSQARGQPVGPNHRQGGHAHHALHLRQNGSPVRSRRPHQLRQSNPTPCAHRRRQDDLHHEDAIAGAHGPWATERGKCPINKTSEDSVPRRAQIQAPQGTKSSLDIRILFSLSHRAKPLRQHTAQPSYRRPGREGRVSS